MLCTIDCRRRERNRSWSAARLGIFCHAIIYLTKRGGAFRRCRRSSDSRGSELSVVATLSCSTYSHNFERSLFPNLAYHASRNAKLPGRNKDTIATLNTSIEGTKSKSNAWKDKKNKKRATQTATEATALSTVSASESISADIRTSRAALRCWNYSNVGHISRNCEVARDFTVTAVVERR